MSLIRTLGIAAAALASWLLPATGHAQLVGPTYPAPGGNTFVAGTYSGFDTSAFSQLYWGASSAALPGAGLDGSLHGLTFSGVAGTTATWVGTTGWTDTRNGGNTFYANVPIALQVTVTGLGATPWLPAGAVPGLAASVGAVIDDSAGLSFTRTLAWTATAAGYAANTPLSQIQVGPTPNLTVTSFTGGFYATAPVPEPAGYALALAGFGVLGFSARRRQATKG